MRVNEKKFLELLNGYSETIADTVANSDTSDVRKIITAAVMVRDLLETLEVGEGEDVGIDLSDPTNKVMDALLNKPTSPEPLPEGEFWYIAQYCTDEGIQREFIRAKDLFNDASETFHTRHPKVERATIERADTPCWTCKRVCAYACGVWMITFKVD